MYRLTLNSIRARKTRFLLSALAVALGVAFMAGTMVLTDTMRQAYDGIAATAGEGTDALVRSNRVVIDPDTGREVRGTVDHETLAAVREVATVETAEARVEGIAQLVGRDGRLVDDDVNRSTPLALAWQHDEDLNPMELVAGRAPVAPHEIVVDVASAEAAGIEPGDEVHVVTKIGSRLYAVAGVATYGGADDAGGAPVIAFTLETASAVLGTPGRYDGVQVEAVPGVREADVVADIAAALGSPTPDGNAVEVLTGAEMIADAQAKARDGMGFISVFLTAFAVVALLVGSFVIANSFSITVAQRTRESALTRAIGATRRQVLGAVLLESAATGLVASGMGVVIGIATALGLRALLAAMGLDLPSGPAVVSVRTILASAVVGTTVAVAAAFLPARKASRVPPVAAMRDLSVDRTGSSVRRTGAGVAITGLGGALLALGLGGAGISAVGLGAVLVFVGVAVLGPVVARPVSRLIGAPLSLLGMPGTLARENASRNPRRTAATASALMIGVGLVAFMTVLAASAKTSISASVDRAVRGSDYIVSTVWGQGGVSSQVAGRIDALPETAAVTGFRYAVASVEGSNETISAFDPGVIEQLVDLDLQAGDIAGLAAGGMAIHADVAEAEGWTVGDRITVEFPDTGPQEVAVAAVYATSDPMGSYAMSLATYDANVPDAVDHYVLIESEPGAGDDEVRAAVEGVVAGYPTAELQTYDEFKASFAAEIDQMLTLVYALLLLAVVIALFGIANTLALSIHERTRELGLLRAVGMTRAQVRSAVRWESVIIALLGTGLGLLIGLGFGWALVRALADQGLDHLTVPASQLTAVVVAAAVAGIVAALNPARRASRLDVLTALRAD